MVVLEVVAVAVLAIVGMFALASFVGNVLERAGRHYPTLDELELDVVAHLHDPGLVRVIIGTPRDLDELELATPDLREAWLPPELAVADNDEYVLRRYAVRRPAA